MFDDTSVLFGLEDEFVVCQAVRSRKDHLEVVIEMREQEGACPSCGVLSSLVKERPLVGSRTCRPVGRSSTCGGASAAWCVLSCCAGVDRSHRSVRRSGRVAG